MLPIRRLLQRELLIFLGLPALGAVCLVWWGMGRALDQQIQARAQAGLEQVAGDLTEDLDLVARVGGGIERLWAQGLVSTRDVPRAEATLAPLLEGFPEVANVVLVTTDGWGLSMSRQAKGLTSYHLDARQEQGLKAYLRRDGAPVVQAWEPTPYKVFHRPWYLAAREAKGPQWVQAYRFINIPTQGLSYVVPLRDQTGAFQGAVCVDVLMETLSRRMAAIQPTPGSQVLLCDGARQAILLPKGMSIPRSKADPDATFRVLSPAYLPLFHEALSRWQGLGRPSIPYHLRHRREAWTAVARPVPAMDWTLILAVPNRDFLGAAHALALVLAAVGAVAALLGSWRLVRLARRISRPLEALSERTRVLAEGGMPDPVATDIEELQHLGGALQGAGEALAREEDLRRQLGHSQRVETLGALAGGIAHDVNNQLAAIVGQLYLAKTQMDPYHPALKRLDRAEEAATRCSHTLRSLLAFSSKASPERVVLDLNALVERTSLLLEPLLGGVVGLDLDLAPGPLLVEADPVGLEQVLMNLAVNARDAMPRGGRLSLCTSPGEGGGVLLTVADTGIGIPTHLQARIFEPFFTTKEIGKGTGLGLAMVQSIVEAHRGTIQLQSRPGEGATFLIQLPAAVPSEVQAPEVPPEACEDGLPGRRVLIVEDEPTLRDMMMDIFIQKRALVEGVPDGAQAWALVQAASYDLIVTDHRMPHLTGLELVERIRRGGSTVPIILASGFGLEGREEELRRDPNLRLLPKPFSLLALFRLASGMLGERGKG